MHPIVFSELHQWKRGFAWPSLVLFCLAAVLQYLLGPPAVLLLLSPTVAAAVGVGTFAMEYSKGELRFLYSLPISPAGLWSVKVLSRIVGTSLVVAVVFLPALFIHRPVIEIPDLDELGLLTGSLLTVFAGQAVLAYAAGLFTIGFSQAPGTAVLMAILLSTVPSLVYLFLAAASGLVVPGATPVAVGLAIASLPLWLGAYVLFRCRNPFVDQPWRWRGVAGMFAGLHVLATIGVAYALTFYPVELADPYRDGVIHFSVFADDSKVFVLGRRSLWDVQAYVLDSHGRLSHDLFRADKALYLSPAPWPQTRDSSMRLFRQGDMSFKRTGTSETWFLLNLDTGAQTLVSKPNGSDHNTTYDYERLGHDGRSIMGFKKVRQGGRLAYSAFREDLTTSDFREIPIFEGQESVTSLYLDDRRVLVAELWSDKPPERKLTLIDLESGERTVRRLPADVHGSYLAPDGTTCTALRWIVKADTVRQELAVLQVSSGQWITVLSPEELPHWGVQDVIVNRQSSVDVVYPDRHSPHWLVCTVPRAGALASRWLINSHTGARFELPDRGRGGFADFGDFSKDSSQFFAFSWLENDQETSQHPRQHFLNVYRLKNSGTELINSFPWDATIHKPAWLGNGRLLYRKQRVKSRILADRGELWTLDIETGQQCPFFAGSDSVADH